MVQSGFPVPPLHVRCAPLLVENAPELLALKESAPSCPVMFRISSRPHAPAVPSAPSTQARKGAPLFENFIGLKGFSPSPRPFRAWVLGADRSAGAWGSDAVRNVVGKIGAIPYGVSIAGTSDAFYENGTALGWQGGPYGFQGVYMDISRAVPTGPQNVPPHNWQPVILYLGRPK